MAFNGSQSLIFFEKTVQEDCADFIKVEKTCASFHMWYEHNKYGWSETALFRIREYDTSMGVTGFQQIYLSLSPPPIEKAYFVLFVHLLTLVFAPGKVTKRKEQT